MGYPRLVVVLTVAGAAVSGSLHAEPSTADRTLAVALFREAKVLMDKGDLASACTKLEESQRLDPGGGTLLNLAVCHEKLGKSATAWAEFIEARGIARHDNRQSRIDLAEEHIAKLEPLLSRLTIVVPPEADDPSLEVTRDGAAVGRAAWGMPFPVDPGEHRVQAAAPNKTPFSSTITVSGESPTTLTVRIPPLVASALTSTSSSAVTSAMPATATSASPATESHAPPPAALPVSTPAPEPDRTSAQRVWAWGAIGLGGAGLVTGTALTVLALNKKSESQDRCPHDPCDAEEVSLGHDAARFADFATVGFGVGFAALATGVILLLTDGSGSRPAAAARAWEVYPQVRTGTRGEAAIGLKGLF